MEGEGEGGWKGGRKVGRGGKKRGSKERGKEEKGRKGGTVEEEKRGEERGKSVEERGRRQEGGKCSFFGRKPAEKNFDQFLIFGALLLTPFAHHDQI